MLRGSTQRNGGVRRDKRGVGSVRVEHEYYFTAGGEIHAKETSRPIVTLRNRPQISIRSNKWQRKEQRAHMARKNSLGDGMIMQILRKSRVEVVEQTPEMEKSARKL